MNTEIQENNTPDKGDVRKALIELIVRARNDSQEAILALTARYKPLIEAQVAKHRLEDMSEQDVEDLREEAHVIFCNAVCNYDLSMEGVEFGLFAKICIENGLISFVRSYVRKRDRAPLPLENAEHKSTGEADLLQAIIEREEAEELVLTVKQMLSPYENRVWWMYVSGMSVSEIARSLGQSDSKSVSNAVYRIRRKLREGIGTHKIR